MQPVNILKLKRLDSQIWEKLIGTFSNAHIYYSNSSIRRILVIQAGIVITNS